MAPRLAKKKLIIRRMVDDKTTASLFTVGKTPTWRDYEALKGYMTVRGRIMNIIQTGLSSKQQRQLANAIKNARHLGLLPFVAGK